MMKCAKCGCPLKSGDKKCPACGMILAGRNDDIGDLPEMPELPPLPEIPGEKEFLDSLKKQKQQETTESVQPPPIQSAAKMPPVSSSVIPPPNPVAVSGEASPTPLRPLPVQQLQQSANPVSQSPQQSMVPDVFPGQPFPVDGTQSPPRTFNSHIVKSIVTTLFCCQLLGIVAIIFSILAMINDSHGDYEKADGRAKTADTLCNVSLILGLVILGITMLGDGCLIRNQ